MRAASLPPRLSRGVRRQGRPSGLNSGSRDERRRHSHVVSGAERRIPRRNPRVGPGIVLYVEDRMREPSSGEQQRSVSARATRRDNAERPERAKPAELPVDRAAGLPARARGRVDRGRDREPGARTRETRSPPSTLHPCDRWCGRQESKGRSNDVARSDAQSGSATCRHVDRSMARAVRQSPALRRARTRAPAVSATSAGAFSATTSGTRWTKPRLPALTCAHRDRARTS